MTEIFESYISIIVKDRPKAKNILQAWRFSRPNEAYTVELETIAKIDVPVNEFGDFVVEMNIPIFIREMLFGMRDHVAWARTSRVDDLTQWPIYHGIFKTMPGHIRSLATKMSLGSENQDQDQFRMNLPLAYMTKISMKITPRSMVKLYSTFRHEAKETTDLVIKIMFEEMARQLIRCLEETPWLDIARKDGYGKMDLLTRDGMSVNTNARGFVLGGLLMVALPAVPLALRAQLVRHRPVNLRDNLVDYATMSGLTHPISSPVRIEMGMTVEMAKSIVKKRNCWIAQDDLWRPIIEALNEHVNDQGNMSLPCSGGCSCPVARDNDLRLAGKDPAPPCPIWMKRNEDKYPQIEMKNAAYRFALRRSNPLFWEDHINGTDL